jgi:hypothetical protein
MSPLAITPASFAPIGRRKFISPVLEDPDRSQLTVSTHGSMFSVGSLRAVRESLKRNCSRPYWIGFARAGQ